MFDCETLHLLGFLRECNDIAFTQLLYVIHGVNVQKHSDTSCRSMKPHHHKPFESQQHHKDSFEATMHAQNNDKGH